LKKVNFDNSNLESIKFFDCDLFMANYKDASANNVKITNSNTFLIKLKSDNKDIEII